MTQIKPNRRAHKTIHKTYRFLKADLWGHLAKKLRDTKITRVVAAQARMDLRADLRRYPKKLARNLRRYFYSKNNKNKFNQKAKGFLHQLTKSPKQKRSRQAALQHILLKLRKKLSLFYGGGKIRAKTYRRFAKLLIEKAKTLRYKLSKFAKDFYHKYINSKNYTKFLEARLDTLLLRSGFLTTIFMIRQAVVHRKLQVRRQKHMNHPGFLVKTFRVFRLLQSYRKKTSEFFKDICEKSILLNAPRYMWINYSVFSAFKFREPKPMEIGYPFRTLPKGPLVFKHVFI